MSELTDFELTNLIFVFGTLKKGYRNNERCLRGAEFLGEATSLDNYIMQDVGFPTLWLASKNRPDRVASSKGRVAGEIYRVSLQQFEACDRLEGNGQMYTRELRAFRLPNASRDESLQSVTAWIYLWNLGRYNNPVEPVDGVLVWDREGKRKMMRGLNE
jgi:gamma-glutamylcyclotransferase (GGCT)/AIG2-like uncharacterized protein YtfP